MMLFSYNNLELWKKAWLHSMFMLIFVFPDRKGVRHDSWDAKRKDSSCYGSTGRIRLRGKYYRWWGTAGGSRNYGIWEGSDRGRE